MTQEELNYALFKTCGYVNGQARAEELLGRGADPNALVDGKWNALHLAARWGREQIVAMLLSRGAVLEARTGVNGSTALLLAALWDEPEVWLLLIAKGADLRVRCNDNQSALSHYGYYVSPDPSVKAQRVAELKAAFLAGCHPSQMQRRQRRKDKAWARRGSFVQVMAENRFQPLLHVLMADLQTALPPDVPIPDVPIPDEPTETEEQRRALLHRKVFGLKHVVRGVAGYM